MLSVYTAAVGGGNACVGVCFIMTQLMHKVVDPLLHEVKLFVCCTRYHGFGCCSVFHERSHTISHTHT